MKVYFQIGTNTGNDLFRKKCISEKPDLIILVEPNKELKNTILTNYKTVEGVKLYTNALYYRSGENIKLYLPWADPKTKISKNGLKYNNLHYTLLPMNDWGDMEKMRVIETESITFDDICQNNGITKIDYLQMDTEGFDSEIINMIDFKKYDIKQIRFEVWSFDSDKFSSNFPDIKDRLGKNGGNLATIKLKEHGYECKPIYDQDGNDIMATKIN